MRSIMVCATAALLAVSACSQSMSQQARYQTQGPAPAWPNGAAERPLPPHAQAQDALARSEAASHPPPATPALLARGRERYDIYCTPCHGLSGDGDGSVVQRGFPAPPSYREARLRAASGVQLFSVIGDGYGVMPPYGDVIAPTDRWAIVAYLRALQLSHPGEPPALPGAAGTSSR
jgi:mono/diheme cytochrome c family protein